MRILLALVLVLVVPGEDLYKEIAEVRDPLPVSPMLQAAAEHRARDMAERGYFSHTSPDGETVFDLLSGYSVAGEILAWNSWPAELGAAEAVRQWLGSPSHRDVLLGEWTHIGVGVASTGDRTYFVAVFAVLTPEPTPKPQPTVAPKPTTAPRPAPTGAPQPPPKPTRGTVYPTLTLPPTDTQ